MKRRLQLGFSLVELMIVVAVIMALSASMMPNFLRARQNAYEVSALGFLRTLQAQQIAYRTVNGSYATSFDQLPDLAMNVIDPSSISASGNSSQGNQNSGGGSMTSSGQSSSAGSAPSMAVRSNYLFSMTVLSAEEWQCTADPLFDRSGGHYLYTDSTGAIRSQIGATATSASPAMQ